MSDHRDVRTHSVQERLRADNATTERLTDFAVLTANEVFAHPCSEENASDIARVELHGRNAQSELVQDPYVQLLLNFAISFLASAAWDLSKKCSQQEYEATRTKALESAVDASPVGSELTDQTKQDLLRDRVASHFSFDDYEYYVGLFESASGNVADPER